MTYDSGYDEKQKLRYGRYFILDLRGLFLK